jgi:hypothetical protein
MVANDVYTIAKALSKEEFVKLANMLRKDLNPNEIKLKKKNKLPDYTINDALRFLLDNHIKKQHNSNRTSRTKI